MEGRTYCLCPRKETKARGSNQNPVSARIPTICVTSPCLWFCDPGPVSGRRVLECLGNPVTKVGAMLSHSALPGGRHQDVGKQVGPGTREGSKSGPRAPQGLTQARGLRAPSALRTHVALNQAISGTSWGGGTALPQIHPLPETLGFCPSWHLTAECAASQ